MNKIDIVLPAYNPTEGWAEESIQRLSILFETVPDITFRVFIVPDGSRIGHSQEVRDLWKRTFWETIYCDYPENKGKGYAVRHGVSHTDAPFVLYTDYDLPFTTETYKNVIELLIKGEVDVVIPRRNPDTYEKKIRFKRRILSQLSHVLNKILLFLPTIDTQGGLKGFSRQGRSIFLKTKIKRFLFDTEFICLATKKGLIIKVIHGDIRPEISLSVMKTKTILRELYHIPQLIRARWFC